jgi:tRNA(adenine34) deaminase
MRQALDLAKLAASKGEVPVGAIVVRDDQIIASSYNLRETDQNPVAHAEILAIQSASKALSAWRLERCTLYVTLEPCVMCAGALLHARIPNVVFAASDPKGGAYGSLYNIQSDARLNHRPNAISGILADESAKMLQEFFRARRN